VDALSEGPLSWVMKKIGLVSSIFAVLAVSALVVGCSEGEVTKADVEQNAMKQLTANVGKPSPPITCPGNLKAKVGEKLTCSMPIDSKTYDVTVSVTAVSGTDVKYDVEVASAPRP